jgi:hypothetical protein
MDSEGTLVPVIRQRIYTPIDNAMIEYLPPDIVTGSRVVGPSDGLLGTTLLKLHSSVLATRETELLGDENEIIKNLENIAWQLLNQGKQMNDYERAQKKSEEAREKIKLETVQKKLDNFELLEKPFLYVTSPIDGVVVTSDVKRLLSENKPLHRMQYLMEVADLDGEWELELLMPERKMGYIMEQKRRMDEQGKPLQVEFHLATKANKKHYGTVVEIYDRAEVRSETVSIGRGSSNSNVNTVLIKVALKDIDALREKGDLTYGAGCRAQIDCGKRPLGYVIFYEPIVYIQKNILFRWF